MDYSKIYFELETLPFIFHFSISRVTHTSEKLLPFFDVGYYIVLKISILKAHH